MAAVELYKIMTSRKYGSRRVCCFLVGFGRRRAACFSRTVVLQPPDPRSGGARVVPQSGSTSHEVSDLDTCQSRQVCFYTSIRSPSGSISPPARGSGASQPPARRSSNFARPAALGTKHDLAALMSYAESVVFASIWSPSGSISRPTLCSAPSQLDVRRSSSFDEVRQHLVRVMPSRHLKVPRNLILSRGFFCPRTYLPRPIPRSSSTLLFSGARSWLPLAGTLLEIRLRGRK